MPDRPIPQESRPRTEPLWKGPDEDGITYSLLCKFLNCRERFRLLVVEGLKAAPTFSHRLEYGQMWHVCEEALASERNHFGEVVGTTLWGDNLRKYAQGLVRKYPLQREQVEHWYNVCKVQFPVYVRYWAEHQDVVDRTPLLQEQVFCVPYTLPSGRTVKLRGKWDAVDLIGKGKSAGIDVQENKTKGDIDEQQIKRQLAFDLQTMLYIVALKEYDWRDGLEAQQKAVGVPIRGVRYNVVRRWGYGEGAIVRHKATQGAKCPKCKGEAGNFSCTKCEGVGRVGSKPEETKEHFYQRISDIINGSPESYFMRWKCEVSQADINNFRRCCLDPILECLCEWWDFVKGGAEGFDDIWSPKVPYNRAHHRGLHWQHPFGVYNSLDEGGSTDLDAYLVNKSVVGLARTDTLFGELECS